MTSGCVDVGRGGDLVRVVFGGRVGVVRAVWSLPTPPSPGSVTREDHVQGCSLPPWTQREPVSTALSLRTMRFGNVFLLGCFTSECRSLRPRQESPMGIAPTGDPCPLRRLGSPQAQPQRPASAPDWPRGLDSAASSRPRSAAACFPSAAASPTPRPSRVLVCGSHRLRGCNRTAQTWASRRRSFLPVQRLEIQNHGVSRFGVQCGVVLPHGQHLLVCPNVEEREL